MANISNKEKKRRKEQERLLQQLQQLMFNNYMMTFAMPSVRNAIKNGNDAFFFSHNHTANKAIDKQLRGMAKQMDYLLLNGIEREWKYSDDNFWGKLQQTFSKSARDKKAFDQIRETATQSSRDKTAKAFYNEKKDNGLNVSNRVWNLAKNSKKELEIIIQNGIKEGKSADEIQKSLKGYLKDPEKLFRRVKNKETGKLELSKAAQKYKPGQGVYRSAYKNAMRLARTELKAAQCESVWNSAQNNPLITGWRIVLSNNHTTLVNGKPVPFRDICDRLQGVYPKSFKFKGWHPQCRCEMLPILITEKERKALYKSIFEGKEKEWKPKQITEMPKTFDQWVKENKERAKGWANMPRFLKDNPKYAKNFKIGVFDKYLHTSPSDIKGYLNEFGEITDKQVKGVIALMAKSNPDYFPTGFDGVSIAKNNMGMMAQGNIQGYNKNTGVYTKKTSKIYITDRTFSKGFNPANELRGALTAIRDGKALTFNQEYAVESLWHEIRHAGAKGWHNHHQRYVNGKPYPGRTVTMEVVNQFCARRSYDVLLKQLGGSAANMNKVVESGYGYSNSINNFNRLLEKYNIPKQRTFNYFKDKIQTTSYEKIEYELIKYLELEKHGVKNAYRVVKSLNTDEATFKHIMGGK